MDENLTITTDYTNELVFNIFADYFYFRYHPSIILDYVSIRQKLYQYLADIFNTLKNTEYVNIYYFDENYQKYFLKNKNNYLSPYGIIGFHDIVFEKDKCICKFDTYYYICNSNIVTIELPIISIKNNNFTFIRPDSINTIIEGLY